MDQFVTQYYRQLLRGGHNHTGKQENPSVFLDSVGEKIRICGNDVSNYMHLFIRINDDVVDKMTYLCLCDPTANVVVEILCGIVEGKTLEEVDSLNTAALADVIGTHDDDFLAKAKGLIELMKRGFERYRQPTA